MSLDEDHQIYKPILLTRWTCCWDIIRQYPGSHESRYFNHPHWCRILSNHMISDDFLRGLQQVSQELVEVFSMTLQGVCKSFNGHQSCKKQRLFSWGMGWNVETWHPNLPLVGFWLTEIPVVCGSSVVLPYFFGPPSGGYWGWCDSKKFPGLPQMDL